MSYLVGALVRASDVDDVCAAVRAGFGGIGANEGTGDERLDVRVGEPVGGWILITDSTHHTFDLGVAEAIADALKTRVAVFGSRGTGTYGKGVIKSLGTWKTKLPGSLKPSAVYNAAIYINAACVRHELGDTAGALAALEAARRHKLVDALAKLRDEPMFATLRGDPRFDAATAPRAKRKAATRRRR